MVLPVAQVHLHDPHTMHRQLPGQACAVTAGALDTDHHNGSEPAQPAQRLAYPPAPARSSASRADHVHRVEAGEKHFGITVT